MSQNMNMTTIYHLWLSQNLFSFKFTATNSQKLSRKTICTLWTQHDNFIYSPFYDHELIRRIRESSGCLEE